MKNIDKSVRAKAIKDLTQNGRNRTRLRQINNLMEDPDTLAILNALFASTQAQEDKNEQKTDR